jgi:enamine deaminase RidA (YjgF/YER057c/UK114 family)
MDRRDILAENPVEKRRGYMPGVSVAPDRILFTAGMTGRQPDGTIIPGGMAAQTRRTMERLQAILQHAGADFSQVMKQLLFITDMEAHATHGRAVRAEFFGEARPTSTALGVQRLADPAMLIEIELVVDLPGDPAGKPLLEKYNVENHGLDFYQGVIVNDGRLIYLAGQVANTPDGAVAGVGDWKRQAEHVYANIGNVLQAAGASPAQAVKETTWVRDIASWRQHGTAVRRAFYQEDYPASTLVEIPGLASPDFLVEVEVIAALPR